MRNKRWTCVTSLSIDVEIEETKRPREETRRTSASAGGKPKQGALEVSMCLLYSGREGHSLHCKYS